MSTKGRQRRGDGRNRNTGALNGLSNGGDKNGFCGKGVSRVARYAANVSNRGLSVTLL